MNDESRPSGPLPAWARGNQPNENSLSRLPRNWPSLPHDQNNHGLVQVTTGSGKTHSAFVIVDETRHIYDRDGQHRVMEAWNRLRHLSPSGVVASPQSISPPPPLPNLVAIPAQLRRLRVVPKPEQYQKAMSRAEEWERTGRDQQRIARVADQRVRNPHVRKAVLMRSNGRCENPACRDREPVGYTDDGDPILEIDHVIEHAKGGRDHGSNTIALCPNCHALKTRGRDRHALAVELGQEAARLHQAAMSRSR
ncbi:HNH endonuclease [Streptomyces sp. NPDC059489]|uniref:HNH endonuclease n=1 Tax=Streptomyces sp. NPDC059489 TaxID=3346849 RepID=UPI00369D5248